MTARTFGNAADSVSKSGEHGVWIDLVAPTAEEIADAGQKSGLRIPSREDLEEIETSSRTYTKNGALYNKSSTRYQAAI